MTREPFPEGKVLANRYRVMKVLDAGGMSTIYLVEDVRLSKQWAIKELHPVSDDPREQTILQQLFKKEAEILAQLSHPNLPRVVDYFVEEGREFLVEDLLEGKTLQTIAKEMGTVSEKDAVGWAAQICDCLSYVHSKGIVYRDLKPANVFIASNQTVKLLDFGIARFYSAGKSQDTIIMGTPGFSAPEQYGTGQTDARSDLFSLGAMLHFLLTGRDPCATPFVFPPVRSLRPSCSSLIEAVISRATQMDPQMRFQSAQEFRDALLAEESPAAETEVFTYAPVPASVSPFALASLLLAGINVGLVMLNPIYALDLLLLCALPAVAGLPPLLYLEQKKKNAVQIIAGPKGIVYTDEAIRIDAGWEDVESLSFQRASLRDRTSCEVQVRTRKGKFPYDASTTPSGEEHPLALVGHQRLTEILIGRCGLKPKEQGSNVFVRKAG